MQRKALELIEAVGQEPTLDVALDRDRTYSEDHLKDTIRALRSQRGFIVMGRKKKAEGNE